MVGGEKEEAELEGRVERKGACDEQALV